MKGIFLAFVCAFAFTTAEEVEDIVLNQHGCPIDLLIKHFLPHKYCDGYYTCIAGLPTLIKCPEHTLYDLEANVCDWAKNVDCGDRIHPSPKSEQVEPIKKPLYGYDDPSQAPAICAEPDSDNILISHEDCRKYYLCWLGSPLILNCPSYLFYNPIIGGCAWQANVDCKLPEEHDFHMSYPERLCNKGSFLVPHETYCNMFYKCGHKGPSPMDCPFGTVFDYVWQICNWPTYVNCGDKIIKPIEPPVVEPEPEVPESKEKHSKSKESESEESQSKSKESQSEEKQSESEESQSNEKINRAIKIIT